MDTTRTDANGYFTEAQSYSYEPNPEGHVRVFRRLKNGLWKERGGGQGLLLGERRAYRDPHF